MRHSLAFAVLALALPYLASGVARAQQTGPVAQGDAPVEEAGEAQQPPAPKQPRRGIEEIVVQAGESEAAGDLDAGDSVTGFDASDLQALGAQSIEDLAGFTPNLEIVTTGATTPTFFIRGVGLNDFNANSSGAVAIYQDDVPKNAPALQLGTLFDMEAVNVLRGPQGTGPARNASAGAIKLYSRKPTGDFGGYLRTEIGNFNARDFEGAVEMPIYQDILSTRMAFRFSERDGYVDNRCGSNPRQAQTFTGPSRSNRNLAAFGGFSTCGESVFRDGLSLFGTRQNGRSPIPEGLPDRMNDRGTWAMRSALRFQPTLDQDWLMTFSYAKRNELAEVGQSIGTGEQSILSSRQGSTNCADFLTPTTTSTRGIPPECLSGAFGSRDGGGGPANPGYQPIELVQATKRLDPCQPDPNLQDQNNACATFAEGFLSANAARLRVARDLELDRLPFEGDYDRAGKVKNDVWGVSLKGDIAIGDSLTLTTVTGYDTYDRSNDVDLDFTPQVLFEIDTLDEGWQVVQDLQLSGALPNEWPVNWRIGGFTLIEELEADTEIFLPPTSQLRAATRREWNQKLWSAAGYFSFDWDFWDDFTLDGGVRYNWEKKSLDLLNFASGKRPENPSPFGIPRRPQTPLRASGVFQAPTGTIRLTYRFREDTHAFWKYTRGWKGVHYNVTVSADDKEITQGLPEKIDAFETGVRGSWFNGRLGLNASLFHYAYSDYQIFTVRIPLSGTPSFVVLNASDAEVYGGELEMTARPISGMFLEARVSWLESQFLDFKQNQAQTRQLGTRRVDFIRELNFSGNRLLNSPPFTVALTAEQTLPLGRYGSLTFRWDGRWTDATSFDASEGAGTPTFENVQLFPEDTIGQPPFWLHNFNLSYRTPDGGIELGAWVRNATDEVYKTFAFDASGLDVNQTTIHFVGEPRTYGLSLTAFF